MQHMMRLSQLGWGAPISSSATTALTFSPPRSRQSSSSATAWATSSFLAPRPCVAGGDQIRFRTAHMQIGESDHIAPFTLIRRIVRIIDRCTGKPPPEVEVKLRIGLQVRTSTTDAHGEIHLQTRPDELVGVLRVAKAVMTAPVRR